MNEMRKLIEAIQKINEEPNWKETEDRMFGKGAFDRWDKPTKKQPLDYAEDNTYMAGPVSVDYSQGEYTLEHGHGQVIYLSQDEFNEFINGING